MNQSSRRPGGMASEWRQIKGQTIEQKNLVQPDDHLHNNTTQHSCQPTRSNCQRGHPPLCVPYTQQRIFYSESDQSTWTLINSQLILN